MTDEWEVPEAADSIVTVISKAREWSSQGLGVALAMVLSTWRSAPRAAGSVVVVNSRGEFCGSVSGGCVEAAVIEASLDTLSDGVSRELSFGVTDEFAWSLGLACGGKICVRTESITHSRGSLLDLYLLATARLNEGKSCALITNLETGRAQLANPDNELNPALEFCLHECLRRNYSKEFEVEGQRLFVNVFQPPVRLIILGGVHIAQALAPIAKLSGFEPIIVEPRSDFGLQNRFPGIRIVPETAGRAVKALAPDIRTAIVALTHNPELDDPGLLAALDSPAFYIGALGSIKTQKQRRIRLSGLGVDSKTLERLHGPIGLAIGATGPAEIAISILAEAIASLRGEHSALNNAIF